MWIFIALVEIYDVYLSIKLADFLYENELNPIGKYLIKIDDGDVALFMAFKIGAIISVLSGIIILFVTKRIRIAWTFLGLAFVSRLILLLFLETGHLWF